MSFDASSKTRGSGLADATRAYKSYVCYVSRRSILRQGNREPHCRQHSLDDIFNEGFILAVLAEQPEAAAQDLKKLAQ